MAIVNIIPNQAQAARWRASIIAVARNPICLSALIVVAIFILLRGNPSQFYWSYIFEGLRIYAIWPLILLGGLTLFSLLGYFHHRSSGEAIYFPVLAFLAALLFVLIWLDLLTAWAVDWPVWGCIASLFLMFLIALAINIGLMSYCESWRKRCNEAVIRRVRDALGGSEFGDYLRGGMRPYWGSEHCLRIVEGHYAQTRENILNNKDPQKLLPLLETCFRAGETLLAYLELPFAEEEERERRHRLIAQTAPEMAAVCLWLADLRGARESVDYSMIERWMKQARDLGPDYRSYADFLEFVFRLGQSPARPYEETVRRAMKLFAEAARGGVEAWKELPEVCADSWLAVSPTYLLRRKGQPDHLPQQIAMDVWLAIRRGQRRDVFVSTNGREGMEIVRIWARRQLAANYAGWRDRTHEDWNQLLGEREREARQLVEQQSASAGARRKLEKETQEIHSWPYLFVFKTPEARRLLVVRSCLITALIALALIAVNPRLPLNWGWNTVDHVADRRAWREYGDAEARAMADSQNLIALATDAGVIFIDKHSRVPRVVDEDGPALDVARAPEPDVFLALADNGAITQLSPRAWSERAPWLPSPENPVWPVSPSGRSSMTALANHLDKDGWLVGIEGLGVARYRFGALGAGGIYRMRSWQLGDLFDTRLRRMQMTETGVWAALDNGVRYAALDTLKEDSGRRLESSQIKRFDADYQGSYAAAVETNDNLWMYLSNDKGWKGPYFGRSGTPLRSAADVTVARLVGDTAWLGTSYGLFAYNLRRRQMHSVVQNAAISQIVAAGDSARVMAASDKGLFLLSDSGSGYSARLLDAGRVDSLSVSPDAALCVYRRQLSEPPGAHEVRSLRSPFDKNSDLLAGAQGWRPLQDRDEVLAVKQLGQQTLFVTSAGSFLYDPAKRLYQDCSVSLFTHEVDGKKSDTEHPLRAFSDAVLDTQQVLSVADDNPQMFSPGENKWRSLDPRRWTQPKQILNSTAGIFGLGRSGEIYRYDPLPTEPKSYLTGASEALRKQPLETNHARGDLVLEGNTWKLALLRGGSATTYDSATGVISDMTLPSADVTQARWSAGRWLYLLGDGRIVGESREELFGRGSLPFAPDSATMIARNPDGSITMGSPGGRIARYQWSNASWTTVGPGPIPSGGAVEMIRETSAGTVAQTSGAEFYLAGGNSWIRLPPYQRWAMGESTPWFWTFDQHSVIRYTPNTAGGEAQQKRFGGGAGIRAFTSGAAFVWQSDANTAVFFTNSARAGVYNSATDEWGETQINGLSAPSRFFIAGGCVIALDGDKVLRISWLNGALRAEVLSHSLQKAALRVDGAMLRLAFVESNDLKLRVWENVCAGGYVEYSRSAAESPSGFDPSRVVYAEAEGPSTMLLVDQGGAAMAYDWVTGVWQLRRNASSGQTVYGLVPGGGQKATMLVLETAQNTYLSVSLLKSPYETIAVPINSPDLSGLVRPRDGELLDENGMRVVRSSNWTGYAVRANDGWRTLRPRAGGFDEDLVQDVAITSAGQLWVLQMGQLSLFEPATIDGKRLLALNARAVPLDRYPATINEVLNHPRVAGLGLMQTGGAETTAALDFNDRQLCWARQRDGSPGAFWRNASSGAQEAMRVWGSCGDRLASQCVQDIAIADGRLLLSTDLGLIVRDPGSYAVQNIYPQFKDARFGYAGGRLLLRASDGIVYEWQPGGPAPADRRATAQDVSIVSGPWVWRRTAQGLVSIVSQQTGQSRRWSAAGGGWRFDDDIATALFRGQTLVIRTRDGFWTYYTARGRGDAAPGPPNDRWSVSHPAVRIAYESGNLSFHPFDGDSRPAFEQGRFFFDNADQFCSLGDYLYTYVPDRGVFRRQARNPLVVDGAWTLPPGLVAGESYILETVSNQVRLRGQNGTVFVLDPSRRTQAWNSAEARAERVENAIGPVVWRAEEGRRPRYEPFPAAGGQTKLSRWWSGNRFAWDDISSASLLDGANAILITAAGPMVATIAGAGFQTQEFLRLPDMNVTRVGEAREAGRRIGLALRGETLFPQYLVTQNAGRPTITDRKGGASLLTEAKLRVSFQDGASTGRHMGLIEEWEAGAGGALESGLGDQLSTGALISGGRFAFDNTTIAAPLMSNGKPTGDWLAGAGCANSPGSGCLVSLFTAASPASGLALRNFWPAPCRFESLRPTPSGGALGLCGAPGRQWQAYRLEWQGGQPNWTGIELGETGEAFRVGDVVQVDAPTMNWEVRGPQYVWDGHALEVAPQGYQLFTAARNGFTLSFDRMNTLALDAGGSTLAVGTDGGVFLWPYRNGGPHLFALGQPKGQFIFNQNGRPGDWILDVTRLRYDADGNLLMKYRPENYVAMLDKAGRLNATAAINWWKHFSPSGEIRLDQEGFVVRGERYTESNDARFPERKKITGIVDFVFERDTGVLWIATRNQGIFKSLTHRLGRR